MADALRIPKRFRHEVALWQQGCQAIAGVDEAGRGPLAGPVVAAAAILPCEWYLKGMPGTLKKVNDSKQLTAAAREELYSAIMADSTIRVALAIVDAPMIDQINILQATHRAMNQALAKLDPAPDYVLVDGLPVKSMTFPQTALVDGDCLSFSIAAASIVAKVTRDRLMQEYHQQYPHYGFCDHKGYGTPEHLSAIKQFGPSPIHRLTFAPVRPVQTDLFE